MKKRASVLLAGALTAFLGFYVTDFEDATWIDSTEKVFRALDSDSIEVVWHHSATSKYTTASRLCEITNERFNLGCSYFLSVHYNGKVFRLNDADELTPSVGGRNSKVLSICFVGNYHENELPQIMIDRAKEIKQALDEFDKAHDNFAIKGYYLHRDFRNTLCPGDKAVEQLKKEGLIGRKF